jgi:hypothetical protein
MTTFFVSHNLQVASDSCPPWDGQKLAEGLKRFCPEVTSAEALSHPHWRLQMESPLDAARFAEELVRGWSSLRSECGHSVQHVFLALGGRRNTPAASSSPLGLGAWGVDVVETPDAVAFLEGIQWEQLKACRPADGVFEVLYKPLQVSASGTLAPGG